MRKLFILLILVSTSILNTKANELVLIETKVYKADKLDDSMSLKKLLANAVLEHNPRMISRYGKKSGLSFSYSNQAGTENSAVEIMVLPNQASQTYDVDINLINEENKNISRIYGHPMGQQFIVSTVIDGAKKIIKVDVTESNVSEKISSVEAKGIHSLANATYILQIRSNLGCDSLDVELKSKKIKALHYLKFTTSAYAAADLPQGEYTFGSVLCSNENKQKEIELLNDKVAPFSIVAGKLYYGGTLIFKKVDKTDPNSVPKVLENCTNLISRARGASSNDCRDGVGVESDAQKHYQINAYVPPVTTDEIEVVNVALSLAEKQLQYLPIVYKQK